MTTVVVPRIVDGRNHRLAVEDLFRATMLAGEPMPFFLHGLDHYTHFALDWYFSALGGHVLVALDDDRVVGYALVATNPNGYARHLRRALAALAARLSTNLILGRINADSRAFYRNRIGDSWRIWLDRRRIDVRDEPHIHMNVVTNARQGTTAAALIDAVDTVVRAAGHNSWVGEVNAVAGRRRRALERVVGTILDERHNVTASRILGTPIVRYTVRRSLG